MPGREQGKPFGVAASRRTLLAGAGAFATLAASGLAKAETMARLPLPDRPDLRPITTAFPQKGAMILQRSRAPLLETPFDVFDQGTFTPNDRFYVRWHWPMPSEVDAVQFRLTVGGHVERPLALSLADLTALPAVEVAAVNQCSGNSRGFFEPVIPGGQWGNGAMGNALWRGVRLKDVLDRAGVKAGAVAVRFGGLEEPVVPDAPAFRKSLSVEHARDGEVLIAYAMNGAPLPLLNGFPLRLVVPGWFATYWVKMLDSIEVLDRPDDNFWMAKAYLIPDTPHADIKPGAHGVKQVPISRMLPRSFITNLAPGGRVGVGAPQRARGVAFGGDTGVAGVDFSSDGGKTWQAAALGADEGKYGFRRWQGHFTPAAAGEVRLAVRCTNTNGEAQPDTPNWNPGGYMRNVIETVAVTAA